MAATAFPPSVRGRPCYYDKWRVAHCAKQGEHIVFMGDSLTRYQWVALAASFHEGVELSNAEFPSLVKEREWRHWMPYYNGSTERLKPNCRCDCHRSFARPIGSKTVENRYYWLPGRLNLSFFQILDPSSVFGHWTPTAPFNNEQHRAQVHNDFAPLWRMAWPDVIRNVVAKLQPPPTVIVLNMGMWGAPKNASMFADVKHAAKQVTPRVLWKTTTRMRRSGSTKWMRTDLAARRTFDEVFDAARLTRHLTDRDYWDPRHFLPHVYNHLNAALLRQLYGPPVRCEEFNHARCSKGGPATRSWDIEVPLEEVERANVVSDALPSAGWAGLAHVKPENWSTLQTLLWVDSLGITHDPKAFVKRGVNGSTLLGLLRESRLLEVGVSASAGKRMLGPRLAHLLAQSTSYGGSLSTRAIEQRY